MNAPMAFIDELHEEKVQSFREVVEEAAKAPPRKSKKKMKWGGWGWVEKNFGPRRDSFPCRTKHGWNWSKCGLIDTITISKKSKGKEKVPKPREELPKHVDFHLLSKSSGDGDSLLVLPLNKQGRGKRGKQALECPQRDKTLEAQEGEVNQTGVDKTSKEFLALLDTFQTLMVQQRKAAP